MRIAASPISKSGSGLHLTSTLSSPLPDDGSFPVPTVRNPSQPPTWIATITNGMLGSSGLILERTSSMSKISGSLSTTSSKTSLARSSALMPPSPLLSRGCSCTKLLQKDSASRSLKPISALGCRPKARGVSGGICSSMNSSTYGQHRCGEG
ncbi:hypothetical protein Vretimale_15382 [Volvox reticuliferus]|uniref:Uncharacterized protein n=1 Tax=Volvox reticuliferus TaxID=1737510 RepID=A0A8J4LVN4_9CHLO|nr:hypothetical protein Vretimale_15382 [Volvox reticuliferus]